MNKKFTSRIAGGIALASAAALALAACSGSGSSAAGGGTTTLKLVVADYGTGPSNTSSKYWATIVTAFEKAYPGGKYTIDSAANVSAFTFLKGLVSAGDTEPNPGTVDRTPLWEEFAQGKIGMINGSPALIPIIQSGGVVTSSDWTSVPIAGKNGPLTTTLGVCDNVSAFQPNGHEAQIKEFLDFAYQDKYQLAFDREYDLLPATVTASKALSSDPVFGPFLTALPNSVQYPSDTAWATVKAKIQQTIGLAVSGSPASELTQLQQIATSSTS